MSDNAGDILRDPAYPDRPQHPDFWALSAILLALDGAAESRGMAAVIDSLADTGVDYSSVDYMAHQRAARFAHILFMGQAPALGGRVSQLAGSITPYLAWLYKEAFIVGVRYAQGNVAEQGSVE